MVAGYGNPDYVPGCALLNDLAAHGDTNEFSRSRSRRYLEALGAGLGAAVGRAAARGEIEASEVDARVRRLEVALVGLNILARNADTLARIDEYLAAIRADLTTVDDS